MYITSQALNVIEEKFGCPREMHLSQEIGAGEMKIVRASRRRSRSHDVTLFIFNAEGNLAVVRKPFYPSGAFRAPSGGVRPGEDFEAGAKREALEETGLEIEILHYVLKVSAHFISHGHEEPWTSYVLIARATGGELRPIDTEEIEDAKWVSPEDLQTCIRQTLLGTGWGLFQYRVNLTDETMRLIFEGAS